MSSSNGLRANQEVGTTVLVVMMEVDEADDEVFNKWYNEEHLPERMSIPGYVSARRFMLDPEDDQANGVAAIFVHLGNGKRQPFAVPVLQGPER